MQAIVETSGGNAEFSIEGDSTYENIKWLSTDIEKPSKEVVMAKKTELDQAMSMSTLRKKRDELLLKSDRYMLQDFPITDDVRESLIGYRQTLRDMPQSGATEFPVKPV